jgi:hypothetical protein
MADGENTRPGISGAAGVERSDWAALRAENAALRQGLELCRTLVHDLNNALTGVLARTDMALSRTKDEEVARHLRIVTQSAQGAAEAVRRYRADLAVCLPPQDGNRPTPAGRNGEQPGPIQD